MKQSKLELVIVIIREIIIDTALRIIEWIKSVGMSVFGSVPEILMPANLYC